MEVLEKEFVPYELALRMKQLEFDEPCFSYYMNGILQPSLNVKDYSYFKEMIEINSNIKNFENVLAPLFQQAFRWFRQEYGLHHVIHQLNFKKGTDEEYLAEVDKEDGFSYFRTYEECDYYCLEKLLEIVEEKQKEDGR
jgi:hypothetical protein